MGTLTGTATLYEGAALPTIGGTVEMSDAEPPLGGTAPTITTTSLANATEGAAASYSLAATGTAPITWSVVTGTLPTGLTLTEATGGIAGTPTVPGDSSFTVRATNSSGTDDQALSISVIAAGAVPTIATPSLATGEVGTAYSGSVSATGTAPITWSVVSGSLPDGLTLNSSTGAITGTPTTAQLRSFTLRATNANGTDDEAVSMMVVGVDGQWTRIPRDVEVWVRIPRDDA